MKKNLMVNVLMYFLCTFQPSLHDAVFAKETLKTESVLVLPDIPGEKRIAYTIHEYPLSDQYCILFLSNSTFRDYIAMHWEGCSGKISLDQSETGFRTFLGTTRSWTPPT